MEESMRIDTVKVERDVSIHNQEDVTGMETDEVCVPQECELEERNGTVTVEGVENIEEEDSIKIKTEEDYTQFVRVIKSEQENSMALGETVPSVCSETCLTVSADGSEVSDIREEEVLHTRKEEDHLAVALPAVTVADMNCMGFVEGETDSYSETCDGGTEEVSIEFEEAIDIEEESIIKVEEPEDTKDEIPEAITFPPIKTEHEGTVNEQLHIHSAECRYSCDKGVRPHSCEECSKAFSNKSHLICHQCLHSGEWPYVCEVCNKAFSQQGNLIRHQRIHSGERPYTCEVCNKAFSRQSHLITHQRIHSGEYPYTCDVCNKAFSEKTTFIRHQRIHSGDRPYTCEVCNKAFSQLGNLIRHQRIHSGERPYTCDVCNKAFSDKSSLIMHLRIHSGERPYTCGVCNKAFIDKSHLIRHQRIHSVECPSICDV